jgi:hypothetical protein
MLSSLHKPFVVRQTIWIIAAPCGFKIKQNILYYDGQSQNSEIQNTSRVFISARKEKILALC